jgi:hypothetical protein
MDTALLASITQQTMTKATYRSALRFCRNMPSGMLVSIHHHEVGIPQVCFASTKRAAKMKTQLTSKRLSSQRFLHLGIIHLSMQNQLPSPHDYSQSVTSTKGQFVFDGTHRDCCGGGAGLLPVCCCPRQSLCIPEQDNLRQTLAQLRDHCRDDGHAAKGQ